MTFFEQLEKHLKVHNCVEVKREDGGYNVFLSAKDEDGNYRNSSWESSSQEARKYIGCFSGYSVDGVNRTAQRYNWQIIDVFDLLQEKFKEGEGVVMLPNAVEEREKRGFGSSEEGVRAMIGKKFKINGVYGSNYLVNGHFFPHPAIAYPFQPEEDVLELTVAQVEQKFGRRVKIIKENN